MSEKFIGKYGDRLRLSVPNQGVFESIYLDSEVPHEDIRGIFKKALKKNGYKSYEIARYMQSYDSSVITKIAIEEQSNNKSGHLGVSPKVDISAIGYVAAFKNKKKRFNVALYPYGGHKSVAREELRSAFVLACREADRQRGIPINEDSFYRKQFRELDWGKWLRNRYEKKGAPFYGLTVTEHPTSNYSFGGKVFKSKARIEKALGISFSLCDIPEENKMTVEGWHQWINAKVQTKPSVGVQKNNEPVKVGSGYPLVDLVVTQNSMGYKVRELINGKPMGKVKRFVAPLYPCDGGLYYITEELEEIYIDACRQSDYELGLKTKRDEAYLESREKINWQTEVQVAFGSAIVVLEYSRV